MLTLNDPGAVADALKNWNIDPQLRALLGRRAWQLAAERRVRFVVIEGGDTPEMINAAVGFALTGENAEEPGYEWIEHHGRWFEILFTGPGEPLTLVYVENTPATEADVHLLCLAHFWPGQDGDA